MPRPKLSDERLSVPVSADTADRIRDLAARYGVSAAQIAQRYLATITPDWRPFAPPVAGKKQGRR